MAEPQPWVLCGDCHEQVEVCSCPDNSGVMAGRQGKDHEPILHTKAGSAYVVTDDGQEVPPHVLCRFECSCGEWSGIAWYVSEDRARAHFERHLAEHLGEAA